jgi:hypothetical protein
LIVEHRIQPIVLFFRPGLDASNGLKGARLDTLNPLKAEEFSVAMDEFLAKIGA